VYFVHNYTLCILSCRLFFHLWAVIITFFNLFINKEHSLVQFRVNLTPRRIAFTLHSSPGVNMHFNQNICALYYFHETLYFYLRENNMSLNETKWENLKIISWKLIRFQKIRFFRALSTRKIIISIGNKTIRVKTILKRQKVGDCYSAVQ